MNDEHINENEFKKYGESKLLPREFLRVQTHLETCKECQRRLNEMFPSIAQTEEVLLIEDLREVKADVFHLNYEEHLKPFIYETIDAVDREIVESHVEICQVCREDLRDLLSFHQELEKEKEIRELSKANWWTHLTDWFSHPNHKALWLTFASIIFIVSAGLIWFFVSQPTKEIVQNQANTTNFPTNQNVQSTPTENINQTVNNFNQNSATPKNSAANTQNQNEVAPKEEPEMAKLVLPKFLNNLHLNENDKVRGEGDSPSQKIVVISPNGKVIRDSSPLLTWQNVPNIKSYEITVFDENDNRLAKIEAISGNSQSISNLPKGKIYQWQVLGKSVSSDGKTTNFIGHGKFYIVSQNDENRINQAKDSLEKGRAYAEAGLLTEAKIEFGKYLKQHPDSKTAKIWRKQIE